MGILAAGCGPDAFDGADLEATAGAVSSSDFDVDFTGCREFAGIGSVPAANARALVPPSYTLAGDANNAVIVVRAADCAGIAVDGHKAVPGRLAHVGISIAGGDPTADINNYQLWFETNVGLLNGKLTAEGVPADLDQDLGFQFIPCTDALTVSASPPHNPTFVVKGKATPPAPAPVPFVATWWRDGSKGTVAMRTEFPDINFGSATMTLTTSPSSALGRLIGGTSLTFPILDSFNAFPTAHATVRVQ